MHRCQAENEMTNKAESGTNTFGDTIVERRSLAIIGVDPDKQGGIAILGEGGKPVVMPMPIIPGTPNEYDIDRVLLILDAKCVVYVETTGPRPRMSQTGRLTPASNKAVRSHARSLAIWETACRAKQARFIPVTATKWQKMMHAGVSGKDKHQNSIIAAQRLFPGVSLLRTPKCRVPSHGMATALLIAEYGRRSQAVYEGEE